MNNNSILVSIIVPVFNVEKHLVRCMGSLLNQSYKNIEIILIDDGSTDTSGKICDKYLSIDSRVRVYHTANNGLSAARNLGILKSNGDYITFVDSDDFVLPEYIKTLLDLCIANNANMSCCCCENIYDKGKNTFGYYRLKNEVLDYESFINIRADAAWAKLYKTTLFSDVKFPVGKKHEDQYVYSALAFNAKTIATSSKTLYMYCKRNEKTISSSTDLTFEREKSMLANVQYLFFKNICIDSLNDLMVNISLRFTKKLFNIRIRKNLKREFSNDFNCAYSTVKTVLNPKTKFKIKHRLIYSGYIFIRRILNKFPKVKKRLKKIAIECIRITTRINKNQIIMTNFFGSAFDNTYREIYNSLISNNRNLKVIWAVNDLRPKNVSSATRVLYGSIKYYKLFYSSKIVIYNIRNSNPKRKKRGQFFVQLWHGSYNGGKKVENDALSSLSKKYIKAAKADGKNTDLMISCGKEQTALFYRSFWYKGPVFECGNLDYSKLFDDKSYDATRNAVYAHFNIPKNKNIILFAPTFRNKYFADTFKIDFDSVLRNFKIKFRKDFVILFHYHKNIPSKFYAKIKYDNKKYFDANLCDIADLEIASYAGIGDYSSVNFELALIGKPVFRFVNDLDYYNRDKGFYVPFEDQPYPFARTNAELNSIIMNFDYKKYLNDCSEYFRTISIIKNKNAIKDFVNMLLGFLASRSKQEFYKKYDSILKWPNC